MRYMKESKKPNCLCTKDLQLIIQTFFVITLKNSIENKKLFF